MGHRYSRYATELTKERVGAFLANRGLTQERVSQWLGVSKRTFSSWMTSGKFPRMLEIVLTHEPPPSRVAVTSKLGPILSEFGASAGGDHVGPPAVAETKSIGKVMAEIGNQLK